MIPVDMPSMTKWESSQGNRARIYCTNTIEGRRQGAGTLQRADHSILIDAEQTLEQLFPVGCCYPPNRIWPVLPDEEVCSVVSCLFSQQCRPIDSARDRKVER
jgi:hypothetical protein